MKVHKIKCDICGKLVDFNSVNIESNYSTNNLELKGKLRYGSKYTNDLLKTKYGENASKSLHDPYDSLFIYQSFDLCEDCLMDLNKIINTYIEDKKKNKEGE